MFTEKRGYTDGCEVIYFVSDNIKARHLFSTRLGGVSTLPHLVSMNLGEGRGDSESDVAENRKRILGLIGMKPCDAVSARQIHSSTVITVTGNDRGKTFADCDGFVTAEPGVVLTVKTADCLPVLLQDCGAGVIGAVHAGWRGSAAGISGICVDRMLGLGATAENIRVAIGAGIHRCCYEVGEDFCSSVSATAGAGFAGRHITRDRDGACLADIVGMNIEYLTDRGVARENLSVNPLCTCCHPELFFSHRFSGGLRGTMCAFITL